MAAYATDDLADDLTASLLAALADTDAAHLDVLIWHDNRSTPDSNTPPITFAGYRDRAHKPATTNHRS